MQTLEKMVLYLLTVTIKLHFTEWASELLFDVAIEIDLLLHIEDTVSLVCTQYCLQIELRKWLFLN